MTTKFKTRYMPEQQGKLSVQVFLNMTNSRIKKLCKRNFKKGKGLLLLNPEKGVSCYPMLNMIAFKHENGSFCTGRAVNGYQGPEVTMVERLVALYDRGFTKIYCKSLGAFIELTQEDCLAIQEKGAEKWSQEVGESL